MDARAVRAVSERYVAALQRRDPADLASCYATDAIVESPMFATLCGRPSIEEAYRSFFTSFPDASNSVDAMVVEPPRLALFTTLTATHINEFFGLPGTGRRVEFRVCHLIEMKDGLIVHVQRVYDFTGLLVQIGVLRARPAKT